MKPASLLAVFLALATHLPSTSLVFAAEQNSEPAGKLIEGVFDNSTVFPGTTRDYAVYVPEQYDADQPASLMVFMDGKNYWKPDGAFRAPAVFDELIAAGDMPTTIAVFVNPGTVKKTLQGAVDRSNRSFEYDSMGDRYSKFLIDEFLPVALDSLNVSSDPADRAVVGISSGGICAFTTAWERPDQFGKVISHIGSFTNIRGGWAYPGLIRKTKDSAKPIKVYLQEGKDDLNNLFGNWPLGNQDMAAALAFAGYHHKLVFTEGGHSGQFAGQEFPGALRWLWDEDSVSDVAVNKETKPEWQPHPDAVPRDDVPKGTLTKMDPFESKIFVDTVRNWSVYVPAQYDAAKPAALMVFQDGTRFADVKQKWRVPTVFDNLIAAGDMPPTIAVFVDPGNTKSKPGNKKPSNRSLEYDGLGDRYSRLLMEEILPIVEAKYNIAKEPAMRAIGGSSSGGICAFTAAWERPDQFGKVYSSVGSFTNLRGGNVYPSLVRKTEQKPIRVYMADTSGDVDNAFGSWPWANQLMASALDYMGYDVRFDWAEGYKHGPDFGGLKFPEAMKWLWRNETHTPTLDTRGDLRGDLTILKLLIPGESWEVVADGLGFADAPCTDADGNFIFCDMKAPAIYRIDVATGARTVIAKEAVSGLEFGPDGLLYGCQGANKRVVSIDPKSGEVKELASGLAPNDLAVTNDGFVLITETKSQQVTRIDTKTGEVSVVDTGITRPNGIALTNDGGTLAVSDSGGEHTWTFRVGPGGTLDAKMPTMEMRLPIDAKGDFKFNEPPPYVKASRGDGMAVDKSGRFYVTSDVGVQIFDPTGRQCGVLPKPIAANPLTSCVLAGANHEYLYVTNGNTVFRRRLMVQ
ncbi:alpha/beta hydrolase-fold protein [Rubripirellula reticaptiva]|uniref:Gluconolactonase n=1 Tax=Rubripirellula reticaptiva TaxID=2528013 RepID=A0A5C6EVI6_9BACT|nr:alpha/beta hydrolase-fold protein [Rubripirellula reticaptiva]TWU51646.1 Gluconolactonase precursor [Rubripirellula reticaptiva]